MNVFGFDDGLVYCYYYGVGVWFAIPLIIIISLIAYLICVTLLLDHYSYHIIFMSCIIIPLMTCNMGVVVDS
jgi:hypothetical protein